MDRRYLIGAVTASLVIGLAACGDSGSSGPSFPDSVSTADAQTAASHAQDFAASLMSFANFGPPGLAAPMSSRLQALAADHGVSIPSVSAPYSLDPSAPATFAAAIQRASAEGCTVSGHGSYGIGGGTLVDVNSNGIPDDFALNIDCLTTDSTSNPDTVFTDNITESVSIKERMSDLFGFDESVVFKHRQGDNFGNFRQVTSNVTFHNSINAGNANNSALLSEAVDSMRDTVVYHLAVGQSWSGNFDPAGTIALGSPLPDGALTFSGNDYVTDNTASNWSFALSTPTALAYSAACASTPPFTAGVIKGLLNNNSNQASFTVTFTGCGVAPTVATNGTFAAPKPLAAR